MSSTAAEHQSARQGLDRLFVVDAVTSVAFGVLSLLAPHGLVTRISGGEYNHAAHEAARLYGCLRIAMGWIVLHMRTVDDGKFRRSVCEGLCACYTLQALAVLRAQFTDRTTWLNWVAMVVLLALAGSYGRFRFGKGGELIKIYELPSTDSRASR